MRKDNFGEETLKPYRCLLFGFSSSLLQGRGLVCCGLDVLAISLSLLLCCLQLDCNLVNIRLCGLGQEDDESADVELELTN